jgi:aspartyl-tRNA(Asn)/glutamyl-tRNA(Gln) amidotransferase subunit A
MSLAFLTVAEAASRIARGDLSPVDLVDAALAQADRLEGRLNAFITRTADVARDEARRAADQGPDPARPLRGIPIAVKDNIEAAGVRATGGSTILADHVPAGDAPAWERLRRAGAILVGKANLQEFGMGPTSLNPHYGPTRNPWDPERVPGGSSGGSAAAVAAGMALAALGTDAGGSVRIPAALCGVVGLKGTHGLVPVRGGIAFGNPTVDHIGPLTRSVADAALLLGLMAGPDPDDPTTVAAPPADFAAAAADGARSPDLRGLRVGAPTMHYFGPIDAEVEAAVRAAIDQLAALGATIVDVTIPDHDALVAGTAALSAEGVAFHRRWMRERLGDYAEDVQARLLANQLIPGADYARSLRARRLLRERYAAALAEVDLLAAPTTPIVAPTIAEAEADAIPLAGETVDVGILSRNTRVANVTGLPAISVPCGFARGLPVGLMLLAGPFAEERLLRAAAAYEATTDWQRRPPLA